MSDGDVARMAEEPAHTSCSVVVVDAEFSAPTFWYIRIVGSALTDGTSPMLSCNQPAVFVIGDTVKVLPLGCSPLVGVSGAWWAVSVCPLTLCIVLGAEPSALGRFGAAILSALNSAPLTPLPFTATIACVVFNACVRTHLSSPL